LEALRNEKQALEAAKAGDSNTGPAADQEALNNEKEKLEAEMQELRTKLQVRFLYSSDSSHAYPFA
jgi:hypothetical protein